ncbi:hypothetical protein G039_0313085 [Pseudomonas aeruginosa VRFPA01]|nr:hypothetical protein G039_0313085 [Pseudomonas aeruginosa VRFPA01]
MHSEIDRHARHVAEADIAVDLGGAKPADSYLRGDRIIAAALASGAQAIHPGYGFLSENAGFARACEEAGLLFLGPPAAAIDAMGSKSAAKALMEEAGVPLVPGYHGEAQDLETFRREAGRIGYPVLLKAAAGGGGKGMKVVEREAELAEALSSAQREAKAPSATRGCWWRNTCSSRATWRSRCSPTATATACTSTNATVRSSAATRRSSRKPPPPVSARNCAGPWARPRYARRR